MPRVPSSLLLTSSHRWVDRQAGLVLRVEVAPPAVRSPRRSRRASRVMGD